MKSRKNLLIKSQLPSVSIVSTQYHYYCTRSIRGWNMSRSLDQTLTLLVLQRALREHKPMIHHSDLGLQYAAIEYVEMLQKAGVKISMAEIGEPTQNGYVERLLRTIKEEEVDLSEYQDF